MRANVGADCALSTPNTLLLGPAKNIVPRTAIKANGEGARTCAGQRSTGARREMAYTTLLIEARQCRSHKARLVIAKLDRLSRNLAFVCDTHGIRCGVRSHSPTSSPFTFCAVKQRILRGGARYRAAWPTVSRPACSLIEFRSRNATSRQLRAGGGALCAEACLAIPKMRPQLFPKRAQAAS